ncbi:MAG TPA: c-type cytochrome [Gemmatimonadaceae bacterium]|nr:c-type cytochrome [Gemmatimonadaceae bacterium]
MRPIFASLALVAALAACRGGDARGPATGTRQAPSAEPPPAVRHDEHVFAAGRVPPAAALDNPYRGDSAAATQGEKLFTAMNCDGCHGGGATGWVGPSLADGRWRYGGADAEIFQSIYYGRPHGMPAFGGLIPREGIWKLVTYLRSLPPPSDVPTESWK